MEYSERAAQVGLALEVLTQPGQWIEVRGLHVAGKKAVCAHFKADDGLARAAEQALRWDEMGAKAVYVSLHPLRDDVAQSRRFAKAEDSISLAWLMVDVEHANHGNGHPATDGEKAAAWAVLGRVRGTLEAAGCSGLVVADSGNGWHLLVPVDWPADAAHAAGAKDILEGLAARCSDEEARVDPSVYKLDQRTKVYGTTARRGEPIDGHPWRYSWLHEGTRPTTETRAANNAALARMLGNWKRAEVLRNGAVRPPLPSGEKEAQRQRLWAQAALKDEAAKVAATVPPGRETQLFTSACAMGNLIGSGLLAPVEAEAALTAAARACGLDRDPEVGETGIADRIARGIERGRQTPRQAPESSPSSRKEERKGNDSEAIPNVLPNVIPNVLRFPASIPASQLKLADPAVAWLWNGFLRRGEITLMPALWKSGKTTLMAHLLKAFEAGGQFLGREIVPARVLYVSEESESRWAARRDQVGLADNAHFIIRPFGGKPRFVDWEAFLEDIRNRIAIEKYGVVVFDTLANLWPLRDENDASAVQAALMPLHAMIGDTVALHMNHHTRKSDGAEATASRGSGALTGFVDTIIEFRRYAPQDRKDRRRVLSGYGRHDETPEEMVIELSETGYAAQGDRETVTARGIGSVIPELLPGSPPGVNVEQLLESWPNDNPPRIQSLRAVLRKGAEDGLWSHQGTGKKGSPNTYWRSAGFPD